MSTIINVYFDNEFKFKISCEGVFIYLDDNKFTIDINQFKNKLTYLNKHKSISIEFENNEFNLRYNPLSDKKYKKLMDEEEGNLSDLYIPKCCKNKITIDELNEIVNEYDYINIPIYEDIIYYIYHFILKYEDEEYYLRFYQIAKYILFSNHKYFDLIINIINEYYISNGIDNDMWLQLHENHEKIVKIEEINDCDENEHEYYNWLYRHDYYPYICLCSQVDSIYSKTTWYCNSCKIFHKIKYSPKSAAFDNYINNINVNEKEYSHVFNQIKDIKIEFNDMDNYLRYKYKSTDFYSLTGYFVVYYRFMKKLKTKIITKYFKNVKIISE